MRHILGLSGGKDSAALAVYMRDRIPGMEYVFCDTGKELPETYEYLSKLEAFLGKTIVRLNAERGFDHWLNLYGGLLPSPRMRWCTKQLKLRPFEEYVGDAPVISYVGLRADEEREGYISHKSNITARFPFKEDKIYHADVLRILEHAGLGLPKYYAWRTRSGCYFCFFQRKIEWLGLKQQHPDLFEQAKKYEKFDPQTGARYTWASNESLAELEAPERAAAILKRADEANSGTGNGPRPLVEVLADLDDDDDDERACLICDL